MALAVSLSFYLQLILDILSITRGKAVNFQEAQTKVQRRGVNSQGFISPHSLWGWETGRTGPWVKCLVFKKMTGHRRDYFTGS